jgi:putative membrane protein insertion efficiency factor
LGIGKGVQFYQRFLSPLMGRSCRYYPSCSNYFLWLLETTTLPEALLKGGLRILRCNQLFRGGIDYPVITQKVTPIWWKGGPLPKIAYWLVPVGGGRREKYIVIKVENG